MTAPRIRRTGGTGQAPPHRREGEFRPQRHPIKKGEWKSTPCMPPPPGECQTRPGTNVSDAQHHPRSQTILRPAPSRNKRSAVRARGHGNLRICWSRWCCIGARSVVHRTRSGVQSAATSRGSTAETAQPAALRPMLEKVDGDALPLSRSWNLSRKHEMPTSAGWARHLAMFAVLHSVRRRLCAPPLLTPLIAPYYCPLLPSACPKPRTPPRRRRDERTGGRPRSGSSRAPPSQT